MCNCNKTDVVLLDSLLYRAEHPLHFQVIVKVLVGSGFNRQKKGSRLTEQKVFLYFEVVVFCKIGTENFGRKIFYWWGIEKWYGVLIEKLYEDLNRGSEFEMVFGFSLGEENGILVPKDVELSLWFWVARVQYGPKHTLLFVKASFRSQMKVLFTPWLSTHCRMFNHQIWITL